MGWSSGTGLFERLIKAAMEHMPEAKTREKFYIDTIRAFEEYDWDCQDECCEIDPVYDRALNTLHPEWYQSED